MIGDYNYWRARTWEDVYKEEEKLLNKFHEQQKTIKETLMESFLK